MKFVINLLFFLAAFQSKADTVLRFQPHITPQAHYLGDLLLISPDTNHWSTIKLDSQPKHGEHISKQQIITWMQHKTGTFNYQWQGKNTATVLQTTQSTSKELILKAQTALKHQLEKQSYSQIDLSSKTLIKDSTIPLGHFKVILPTTYPVAKRVCVRLRYKKKSIPIWFAVKAYQSVLVAQHKMKKHTLIHPADVMLKKQNIAGLNYAPLTQLPKTAWLNTSLNKQQILTQEDLKTMPDVLQGKKVSVTVKEHGISITTEALAQHEGYKGQVVQMKNPQTNKLFSATITGKNQAEIAA